MAKPSQAASPQAASGMELRGRDAIRGGADFDQFQGAPIERWASNFGQQRFDGFREGPTNPTHSVCGNALIVSLPKQKGSLPLQP